MDETHSTDKNVGDYDATTKIEIKRTKAMVEEILDSTTARNRYQPKAAPVSWTQRVLSWFR